MESRGYPVLSDRTEKHTFNLILSLVIARLTVIIVPNISHLFYCNVLRYQLETSSHVIRM